MKTIIILSVGFIFLSGACKNKKGNTNIVGSRAIQIDSLPGQCPYLTKDTKGNPVLGWIRMINDSSFVFCYAMSEDGGKSFGKTVVIPSSNKIQPHGENLPKIIIKPSGEIIALWGEANPNPKNKYSGLVLYSQSFDNGITWSGSKTLVDDTASYDQRYYDVALLPNGEAGIIWLDNRKTTVEDGSGLYFASTAGRNGFQKEQLISQGCCQCCRTVLFVDNKSGIHVLYRGILQDSIRDIVHSVSIDDGKTFSVPEKISDDNWVINGCPHTGPAMTENKNALHFVWFTGGRNKGCYYAKSANNGINFSPRDSISGLGSHPQIASFPGGEIIIVWDETVSINNKFYKRIGVQKRTTHGIGEKTGYITPDTLINSFPVISTLDEKNSLIAYSGKKGEKNYIAYQLINLK